MSTISIIKPVKLLPNAMGELKGRMMKNFVAPLSVFFFGVVGPLVAIFASDFIVGIIGFVAFVMGIACFKVLYSGGEYKPEKSYPLWRLSKERMAKIYKYYTIGGVILIAMLSLYEFKVQYIFYLFTILAALYYMSKSFAVHEDVDYVTNSEVAELLGLDMDEKIQASYQNFDSVANVGGGCNMILLTDKKLVFAYYADKTWSMINKKISEIAEIGRVNTDGIINITSSASYLQLVFTDGTSVGLHMDLYDKMTSNPNLFFKKFLETIDAVLLGKVDEKITSRRRVSVNQTTKQTSEMSNEEPGRRVLDFSESIITSLKDAKPIDSGRILEF